MGRLTMTTKRAPLDAEALLVDYLRSLGLAGGRVSTDLPDNFEATLPRIRVASVGANAVDRGTAHLWRHRLDLHIYALDQGTAHDVMVDALDGLARLDVARYEHAAGVLTGADVDVGPLRSPDPDTPTERYLATVAIFGHHRPTPPPPPPPED
jgi:hypothetical protein